MTCLACGCSATRAVITLTDVPVFCNVLAPNATEARAARTGDVELVQCDACGMIVNSRFDPQRVQYSIGYENSLHHSDTFQAWARSLAERLVASHGLRDGTAVELGCGGGGFLELLCEAGIRDALGYDPSYGGDAERPSGAGTVRIRSESLGPDDDLRADLAVCRHVLEHLDDPVALVQRLTAIVPDGIVYVEVPDAATMLRDGGVYDVIYEHCGYYGAPALRALLENGGLQVLQERHEFGGQYLTAEARPGAAASATGSTDDEVEQLRAMGATFGDRTTMALASWSERLYQLREQGRDVVVWGAGSKGVTFVNLVDGGAVSRLVDVNPRKHGRFVPVTAQPVVAPQELVGCPPDVVVVMNPLYRQEVVAALDGLGLAATVVVA